MARNNNFNGFGVIWTKAGEARLSQDQTEARQSYSPPSFYKEKMGYGAEKALTSFLQQYEEVLRCGGPLPTLPDALHRFLFSHLGSYNSDEARRFLKYKLEEQAEVRRAAEKARPLGEKKNKKQRNRSPKNAADKELYCRKCGGDLRFVELPVGHKHKWRAECTKCKNSNGKPTYDRWARDTFVKTLLQDEPHRVQRRPRAR